VSNLNKSTVIECVASTADRDITGESLDISGADISPLLENRGYLNSDHKNDFTHVVGRVLDAKKIMKAEDCDTVTQMNYWKELQKPFIWAKGEIWNGVGHKEADAIASVYKFYMAKNEAPPVKISVEGKTLERGDAGSLKRTVIKGLALTLHPCNRTTRSEVVQITKSEGAPDSLVKSEADFIPSFIEVKEGSFEKLYQLAVSARELLRETRSSLSKAEEKGYRLKSPDLLKRLKEITGNLK
jgi:hypothetical protein